MLKIIEQQESYVIKHRSKNMKKTDEGFAGFLQTLNGFFENKLLSGNRNDFQLWHCNKYYKVVDAKFFI